MEPLNAQVQFLRSRVEASLPKPAVVLVTSAVRHDGKSLAARSLADALVAAGHRAALVHLTRNRLQRAELPEIDAPVPPKDVGPSRRDRLEALVLKLRSNYDYTVIDGGRFLDGHAPSSLARLVDGILLAVRVGRSQTADDELMMEALRRSGGRVEGVIATDAEAIAAFEQGSSSR